MPNRSRVIIPLPGNRNPETVMASAEAIANRVAASVGNVIPASGTVEQHGSHYMVSFDLRLKPELQRNRRALLQALKVRRA